MRENNQKEIVMAEDKKDAFTFSDKIKNSKPAFNPFSKRASSKIGNNGKPKKTLFERTRRDAPFFIAALLALLLLPFLYKYSGNVGEGAAFVTPGTSDTVFDPERFDFSPSTEDSSGEIAQLAGRDPLSLIKGWGSATESEESRYDYDMDERDGFADYSGSSNANRSTSTVSTSYRKTVPRATRAAFKRTTPATKIGELRGAGLNARGGGNIGSRFGGANLKSAANRSSAGPVRNPTKPVSLQPLRAAGAPSRSYFGQDNVARARASRDALSKGNAAQALKDAVFNPVGQGRLGGLGEGVLAAGGGPGKMERNMDYKGITPWWWDMMKQREQEKWNWRYHLWRDPLKDAIKTGGAHFFNCLLWGDPDGDIDNFYGVSGEAKAAGCKYSGNTWTYEDIAEKLKEKGETQKIPRRDKFESWCTGDGGKDFFGGSPSFVKGSAATGRTNWFTQRASMCTGRQWWKRKSAGDGSIEAICKDDEHATISFKLSDNIKRKWNTYHIVLAENTNGTLCPPKEKRKVSSVSGVQDVARRRDGTHEDERENGKNTHKGNNPALAKSNRGDQSDQCVIYVAKGDYFDEGDFAYEMEELIKKKNLSKEDIHPLAVRGFATDFILGTLFISNWSTGLPIMKKMPMPYTEFLEKYVYKSGVAVEGKNYVESDPCAFREWTLPEITVEPGNEVETEEEVIKSDDSKVASMERKAEGVAYTRLANCITEVPLDPTGRMVMPADYEHAAGFSANLADLSVNERMEKYGPALDCTSLLADKPYFDERCLPTADGRDDNLRVCSQGARDFVNDVVAKYNEKAKAGGLPQILYNADCPTIANVIDAMHVAKTYLGINQMPKAAVCQLGKMMGRIFKDETVKPGLLNKDNQPYNNTFGAFASYIEQESAYFPAPKAEDSPRDGSRYGNNPRFLKGSTNPENQWHYGNYVWNTRAGYYSKTFLQDVATRARDFGFNVEYPLHELSLMKGIQLETPNTNSKIWQNRKTYWGKYNDIYEPYGCDKVYGTEQMSIANVDVYWKTVCATENKGPMEVRKPRSEPGTYRPGKTPTKGDGSSLEKELCIGDSCSPR
jgi:hypothetical protein